VCFDVALAHREKKVGSQPGLLVHECADGVAQVAELNGAHHLRRQEARVGLEARWLVVKIRLSYLLGGLKNHILGLVGEDHGAGWSDGLQELRKPVTFPELVLGVEVEAVHVGVTAKG